MCVQIEMWEGQASTNVPDHIILTKAKERLEKIYRNQQGLFKRMNELKEEADFVWNMIEEIECRTIYSTHA